MATRSTSAQSLASIAKEERKAAVTLTTAFHSTTALPVTILLKVQQSEHDYLVRTVPKPFSNAKAFDKLTPYLQHEGRVIRGCNSVLKYLAARFAPEWYGVDPGTQAAVDSVLEWFTPMFGHIQQLIASAIVSRQAVHPHTVQFQYNTVIEDLDALELLLMQREAESRSVEDNANAATSTQVWIATDRCSLADLVGATRILALNYAKFIDLSPYSNIVQWVEAVAGEVGSVFYDTCAQYGPINNSIPALYTRHRFVSYGPAQSQEDKPRQTIVAVDVDSKNVQRLQTSTKRLLAFFDSRYSLTTMKARDYVLYKHPNQETGEMLQAASCIINAPRSVVTREMHTLAMLSNITEGLKEVRRLQSFQDEISTNYVAFDFTKEDHNIKREARFDFVLLHQRNKLTDGCFVSVFTSADEYKSQKGYLRARFKQSGVVVYPVIGHPDKCELFFAAHVVFPALVPSWVFDRFADFPLQFVTNVKETAELEHHTATELRRMDKQRHDAILDHVNDLF